MILLRCWPDSAGQTARLIRRPGLVPGWQSSVVVRQADLEQAEADDMHALDTTHSLQDPVEGMLLDFSGGGDRFYPDIKRSCPLQKPASA